MYSFLSPLFKATIGCLAAVILIATWKIILCRGEIHAQPVAPTLKPTKHFSEVILRWPLTISACSEKTSDIQAGYRNAKYWTRMVA
jgi:hypothetical protein